MPSVLTICLPCCPSALRAQSVWVCRCTHIVVVVSPIVIDPQLPPLLHLLHLEVLVVAGLVVTHVVVVVAPLFGRLGPRLGPIFLDIHKTLVSIKQNKEVYLWPKRHSHHLFSSPWAIIHHQ